MQVEAMKKIIVQKFGGTSVADTDKIKNVAKAVIRERNLGHDVVVVVSAGVCVSFVVSFSAKLSVEINVIIKNKLNNTFVFAFLNIFFLPCKNLYKKYISLLGFCQ